VARSVAIFPEPLERKQFRRLLLVSLLAHGALCLFLGFSPRGEVVMPKGVIAVELVSVPAPAAPRPAPAAAPAPKPAEPAPAPPPPPPEPKQIVLPKETAPPPPEPKPAAEPKPKPKPEPVAKPESERDYADVLSDLRSQVPDEPMVATPSEAPAAAQAPAQTAAIGSPTGSPVPPEFLAWERRARIHIRQNWVVPPSFRNQPLRTSIQVELDASGGVVGEPRIVGRSGNPWYDEGVVRSIQKASPLPPPPEAGEWSFVFVADESF
jgi:outer membrane biosynthesis protein TonB